MLTAHVQVPPSYGAGSRTPEEEQVRLLQVWHLRGFAGRSKGARELLGLCAASEQTFCFALPCRASFLS